VEARDRALPLGSRPGWHQRRGRLVVFGGLRYNDLSAEVAATGPLGNTETSEGDESWVDPILGAHYSIPLSDAWSLNLRGDFHGKRVLRSRAQLEDGEPIAQEMNMRVRTKWRTSRRRAGLAMALAWLAAAPVQAQGPDVDPEAARILKRMTDYVSGLQQFGLETSNTVEVVLHSGQKIQFTSAARATVQRPNKLHAARVGDVVSQSFYYDGRTLTLVNPDDGVYATVAAPDTLDEMIDFARDSLDVIAPAGDLIATDAYTRLMEDTSSGFVVGKSFVDGVRCDHLAFRGYGVDWQIWIEDGARPLPRKYVVTTLALGGAPQFEISMRNWTLTPDVRARQFEFTPPAGARQIEFLPAGNSGAPR
jgi:hypothetical protein